MEDTNNRLRYNKQQQLCYLYRVGSRKSSPRKWNASWELKDKQDLISEEWIKSIPQRKRSLHKSHKARKKLLCSGTSEKPRQAGTVRWETWLGQSWWGGQSQNTQDLGAIKKKKSLTYLTYNLLNDLRRSVTWLWQSHFYF